MPIPSFTDWEQGNTGEDTTVTPTATLDTTNKVPSFKEWSGVSDIKSTQTIEKAVQNTPAPEKDYFAGTKENFNHILDPIIGPPAKPKDTWQKIKDTFAGAWQNEKDKFETYKEVGREQRGFGAKVGAVAGLAAGTAGLIFSPISALFKASEDVPGAGTIVRGINQVFTTGGEAAQFAGEKLIDQIPMNDEKDKEILKQGVGDIFNLAAQIAIGKLGDVALGEKKVALTEKYGEKDAQAIIDHAKELAPQYKATEKPVVEPTKPIEPTSEDLAKIAEQVKTPVEEASKTVEAPVVKENPSEVTKEAYKESSPENTHVTVVDEKTGENIVYKIKSEDFEAVKNHIDDNRDGKAIAGENIDGKTYHLTTKPFESIQEKGFKDGGEIGIKDLPKGNKISRGAFNINKRLVEKGFDAIPEGEQAKFTSSEGQRKRQVKDVAELMTADIEGAKEMALGNKEIPDHIQAQILHKAVAEWADAHGNYALLRDLAGSPHASLGSEHGSGLEAEKYGGKGKESTAQKVVKVTKKAIEVKTKVAESRAKKLKTTVKKQQEAIIKKGDTILKEAKTKKTMSKLEDFINSIPDC